VLKQPELFAEYIKTGKYFDAKTGYEIGIIDMLIKNKKDVPIKMIKSKQFSKYASLTADKLMNIKYDIEKKLITEAEAFADVITYPDASEGINAFLEKREAKFLE